MRKTDYTNNGQQRLLNVIRTLAGNEFEGLTVSAIANAIDVAAPHVVRDLENLLMAGFAEKDPVSGNWRLGPKFVQIAIAHFDHVQRVETRISDMKNRYSRH